MAEPPRTCIIVTRFINQNRGLGRGAQTCAWKVSATCALHDGSMLSFEAPVLDDDRSHSYTASVPPMCSLSQLGQLNAYFDTRHGRFHCMPAGEEVAWPKGTRMFQCERAPGCHWIFGTSHWDGVTRAEMETVKTLQARPNHIQEFAAQRSA